MQGWSFKNEFWQLKMMHWKSCVEREISWGKKKEQNQDENVRTYLEKEKKGKTEETR